MYTKKKAIKLLKNAALYYHSNSDAIKNKLCDALIEIIQYTQEGGASYFTKSGIQGNYVNESIRGLAYNFSNCVYVKEQYDLREFEITDLNALINNLIPYSQRTAETRRVVTKNKEIEALRDLVYMEGYFADFFEKDLETMINNIENDFPIERDTTFSKAHKKTKTK